MTGDAFGTDALRHAVTEAWLASGTRFREDANTEEDHARGYYRDRVVVELAQNAADAAVRAGVPGRLSLRLETASPGAGDGVAGRLVAANTGAPLDAEGVASLAALRASAKPAGSGQVGRFGVGFAAVRSVSDDVTVQSRTGGVRFSLAAAHEVLDAVTGEGDPRAGRLREAVEERGHALPVLRLPFPAPGLATGDPFDTRVELCLRDDDAVASVRAQLAAVDHGLLVALPGLAEITVEDDGPGDGAGGADPRMIRDADARWVVRRRAGTFDAAELADLPLEQRRPDWSLAWALPRPGAAPIPGARVLHAPTPTDVALTFPALLVATFPVDPGRRQVVPGPSADRLAREAGHSYAAQLADVAAERGADVLGLVPTGLPASELDAAIRDAALDALRTTPLLPPGDGSGAVAPADAVLLAGPAGEDAGLVAVLATLVPGLVALPARYHAVARALGTSVVGLADLVDDLPAGLAPARWREVYAALEPHTADPTVLEALAGSRVPLADGRTVTGVRGAVVLPEGDDSPGLAELAERLGVRVVHPEAAHPVLVRAGATPTSPRSLIDDDAVRAAALAAAESMLDDTGDVVALGTGTWGDGEPGDVVDAVLALVGLALPSAELPFWLGELPVATSDGGLAPVRETALPGSWAARVLDELAVVADDAVARYGGEALAAAGSHAGLAVYTVRDVVTPAADDLEDEPGPDDPAGWLADWEDYLAYLSRRLGPGVAAGDLEAVADLDAAAPDALPEVLSRITTDEDARRALLVGPRARSGAAVPSYTAWWLRARLEAPFALDARVPLLRREPAAVQGLDLPARRALGGVSALADLEAADWSAVLDALPDVGALMPVADALAVWSGLASLAGTLDPGLRAAALDPLPDRLPALTSGADGTTVVVHPADDLDVADGARWAQLGPVVPAPSADAAALADLLDLPLAGDDSPVVPAGDGDRLDLDGRIAALDARLPDHWWRHDALTVGGTRVSWWVTDDGEIHATTAESLAAALAEALGRPDRAALVGLVLERPDEAARYWVTTAWDAPSGPE